MRKEFLLGSAAMVEIADSSTGSEKPEFDVKIPPPSIAMGLLKKLIAHIMKKQYEAESGFVIEDIFYDDVDLIEDDIVHLCFVIEDGEPETMRAAKSACEEFLTDIYRINGPEGEVSIEMSELSLYAPAKINLLSALSLYMCHEDIKLSTLDSLIIDYESDHAKEHGREAQRQARDEAHALHAAQGRELWEDESIRNTLFEYVEAKPYPTKKHFEAAIHNVMQVDIPLSMSHIQKTILRESGIRTPESPDDAYQFGGYH